MFQTIYRIKLSFECRKNGGDVFDRILRNICIFQLTEYIICTIIYFKNVKFDAFEGKRVKLQTIT